MLSHRMFQRKRKLNIRIHWNTLDILEHCALPATKVTKYNKIEMWRSQPLAGKGRHMQGPPLGRLQPYLQTLDLAATAFEVKMF
jgi:hypothetical protein